MADWSEEAESFLIEIWADSPCLYDTTCKSYASRTAKRKAFVEIMAVTKMTEAQIKKHMSSLRTQYSRSVRQAPSGSAGKPATKRQDWIKANLNFLAPYVKKRPSASNLDPQETGSNSDDNSQPQEPDNSDNDPDTADHDESSDGINHDQSQTTHEDNMATPRSTKRPISTRQIAPKTSEKKRKVDESPREEEMDVLKSVSRALLAPDPQKDDDEIFGELVSSRLRKLKPGRVKMNAEKIITDALYNAALEQEKPEYSTPRPGYYSAPAIGHAATPHSTPSMSTNFNYADSSHCIGNDPPTYTNMDSQHFHQRLYSDSQTKTGNFPQDNY